MGSDGCSLGIGSLKMNLERGRFVHWIEEGEYWEVRNRTLFSSFASGTSSDCRPQVYVAGNRPVVDASKSRSRPVDLLSFDAAE